MHELSTPPIITPPVPQMVRTVPAQAAPDLERVPEIEIANPECMCHCIRIKDETDAYGGQTIW